MKQTIKALSPLQWLALIVITGGLVFGAYTLGLAIAISIVLKGFSWFLVHLALFMVAAIVLAAKYYYPKVIKRFKHE